MRFFRPLFPARLIFRDALFRIRSSEKTICLTFDDGPDPESTPGILSILDDLNVKAVFFCSGINAEKYPGLVNDIGNRGHIACNHGYSHLNGWKTSVKRYCDDAEKAAVFVSGDLFRPPYGKIRLRQYYRLKNRFRIVFWEVMAFDFDTRVGPVKSLEILNTKIRPGSIIVLHDTSLSTCRVFLKEFIETSLKEGYKFIVPF